MPGGVAGPSAAATNQATTDGTRPGLQAALFRTLDHDGNGLPSDTELLVLAQAFGFDGGREAWAREYHDLCRRFGSHPDGIDAAGFALILDGDDAFYQSDLGIAETEAWCRNAGTSRQPLWPAEDRASAPSPSTEGSGAGLPDAAAATAAAETRAPRPRPAVTSPTSAPRGSPEGRPDDTTAPVASGPPVPLGPPRRPPEGPPPSSHPGRGPPLHPASGQGLGAHRRGPRSPHPPPATARTGGDGMESLARERRPRTGSSRRDGRGPSRRPQRPSVPATPSSHRTPPAVASSASLTPR